MPYNDLRGVGIGCEVVAGGTLESIPVGRELLGRVLDAFGAPLDGLPPPPRARRAACGVAGQSALASARERAAGAGIRVIDTLLTLGRATRGIFRAAAWARARSWHDRRHVKADVNVIALIGERGREVREFVEKHLGAEGLKRSVVVVATSTSRHCVRTRAAEAATTIAEYFRDCGLHVMLTMDSVTTLRHGAPRDRAFGGRAADFARLHAVGVRGAPQLCERCGTSSTGGSITALYTVWWRATTSTSGLRPAARHARRTHRPVAPSRA
jgi:flagellum-specific ATP synthase